MAPLLSGFVLPGLKLAVLTEADLTGRRRAHRTPASPEPRQRTVLRGPQARRLHRPLPPRRRPLRRHGAALDRRRRARLPAARVQGRRQALRAVRPDRRRPPLRGRRGAGAAPPRRQRLRPGQGAGAPGGAADRPGAGRAVPEAAEHARPRLQPRHALAAGAGGRRSRTSRRPTSSRPSTTSSRHGGRAPDGPPGLRRRRLRQDRGGHPGRVQGHAGRQAGRRPGADHPAGPAAPRHLLATASPATRCGSRCCHASSRPARPRRVDRRHRVGRGRPGDRHPPPAVGRHPLQGPRAARGRRGAALRRQPQGGDQAAVGRASTCSRSPPRPSPAPWR